ncbi:CRISPR-associated protein Cas4 [soil metagenome]
MTEEINLTGSAFYNYAICPRKAWLMQYQVDPEREHDLLAQGRLNNVEHYERAEKELPLPGIKVDQIRREGGELVIGEVKKSSSGLEASILQLSFYLSRLEEAGVKARGEVLVPKERKKIPVVLDEATRAKLAVATKEITEMLLHTRPPKAEWIVFCPNCAYAEFCWS